MLFIKFLSLWFLGFFCGIVAFAWVLKEMKTKEQKELLQNLQNGTITYKRFALVCLLFLALVMLAGCAKTMPQPTTQTQCPPMLRCSVYQQMDSREAAEYRTAVELCRNK